MNIGRPQRIIEVAAGVRCRCPTRSPPASSPGPAIPEVVPEPVEPPAVVITKSSAARDLAVERGDGADPRPGGRGR